MIDSLRKAYLLLPICWLLALPGCSADDSEPAQASMPSFDPSYLDTSAEPCSDFYQFACGTWLAQHEALPGYAESRLYGSDQRNSVYFKSLLDAMSSSDPSLRDARTYYGSCLRAHKSPSIRSEPLSRALSEVTALGSQRDLPTLLAHLHDSGVRALFASELDIDAGDPSRHTLAISEAGWSLPARASYRDAELASAYQAHMVSLARAAAQSFTLDLDARAIFDFEAAVAQAGSDDRDPLARYNPVDLQQLASALPGFDWSQYFATRGLSDQHVNLYEPRALPALAALLSSAPLTTLKQYLSWRTLEAYARSIDKGLLSEEFAFHRGVVDGAQQAPSDEYDCLLRVRDVFGFALAQKFVDRFVSSTLKPKANSLVAELESAMRANLYRVAWLDEATRARAQDKLAQLLAKVGYPERWPDDTLGLSASQTFLEQRIGIAHRSAQAQAAELMQNVDRAEFWASPDIANAFYTDSRNDITIPVAVLSDPFFREDRPPAFNFGVLGSIIGHELTHAFDSRGRHFDGHGALVDWWSETTAAEFEHRSQCLVDQFDGYEALPGVYVDGKATLDENIADLGGIIVSFAAFQAQEKRSAASSRFSAEQQFFIAYAQTWCETASDTITLRQIATDPHAPGRFRVNGGLRNLPEFAQAFACSPESALAPTDRCQIW